MRHSVELGKVELVVWADLDKGTLVVGAVTVVGRREDGDTASVMLDLVTFHAYLVRPDNGLETVVLAEALCNIRSELQADATLAGTSAWAGLRIGPEHLHHETRLSRLALLESVQFSHIIQSNLVVGEETAVEHKVLLADKGCQREGGEGLGEELEYAFGVLGLALSLKTIHPVHVVCLVVASVEEERVGVQPLVGVQEQGNFSGPGAAIDKVTVEEECMLF